MSSFIGRRVIGGNPGQVIQFGTGYYWIRGLSVLRHRTYRLERNIVCRRRTGIWDGCGITVTTFRVRCETRTGTGTETFSSMQIGIYEVRWDWDGRGSLLRRLRNISILSEMSGNSSNPVDSWLWIVTRSGISDWFGGWEVLGRDGGISILSDCLSFERRGRIYFNYFRIDVAVRVLSWRWRIDGYVTQHAMDVGLFW